jgi:uncharacterized protein (DUF302 family)
MTSPQISPPLDTNSYSFSVRVRGMDFAGAVGKTIDALKTEGFGVLTDIDVQAVMKSKLYIDTGPYRILGACNPTLAHRAMSAETDIGVLLPCNVVVRAETENSSIITFMDPVAVLRLTPNPEVANVARNVHERLLRVSAVIASPEGATLVHP